MARPRELIIRLTAVAEAGGAIDTQRTSALALLIRYEEKAREVYLGERFAERRVRAELHLLLEAVNAERDARRLPECAIALLDWVASRIPR